MNLEDKVVLVTGSSGGLAHKSVMKQQSKEQSL